MSILELSDKPLKRVLWRAERPKQSKAVLLYELELRDSLEDTREEIHKSQRLGLFGAGFLVGILVSLLATLN